ncbi:MAG: class III signal peptide-containing protein [Candidatus Diapherotrites archaeon]
MQKAQGALEYLLLIGGAVLVAVIVITLILSIAGTGETQVTTSATTAFDKIREAAGVSTNFLKNSSFETWTLTTYPDYWDLLSGVTAVQSTNTPYGNYAVEIIPISSGGAIILTDYDLNELYGKTVKVNFSYKQGTVGGPTEALVMVRSCGAGNSGTAGEVTTNNTWQNKEFTYLVPAGANCIRVWLFPTFYGGPDSTIFDNVKMTVVE